ncbi:MAG: hypothetical protein LW716_12820 [Microcystis sp. 53602_E8]|jgi:hypothetical protein|nr:hypothetical protein [Microcystis sp. 53602_E8]
MTELNSMVVVKDNAIEIERQEELKDFLQEQEQQVLEQFKPGTFGCHELLDRTAMVSDSLERFIGLFVTCYGSIGGHKSTKSLSGKRLN